jgi:hypothetical protein
MKKHEMRELISTNISEKRLFKYKRNKCAPYYNFSVFLSMGKGLLLGLNEDDFIFDGYSIVRFRDINEIELKGDFYEEMLRREGLFDNIETPNIRLDSWRTVFEDLQKIGKHIIVEKESIDDDDSEFAIGVIDCVYNNFMRFKHYDANGIWEDSPLIITYSKVTTVTFGSRYVEMFSKYVQA